MMDGLLPLVSVVTPSLNQGRYIRETIQSVLVQDYPRIEYIIMDGGSSDQTLEILRSYGNKICWVSEADAGQSQAINKGWSLAKGEIISWLNADDLLDKNAISNAVLAFQSTDDNLAGLYGDCDYIDENGRFLAKYPSQPYDYGKLVKATEDFLPQPGTFLRSKIVRQVGMLDESLHYVMDYDLWLRIGMRAKFLYLPRKMSYARLHSSTKTVSSAPLFGEELALIFDKLVADPDFPKDMLWYADDILSSAYIHSASYCFWGGEATRARYYLFKAWRKKPFPRIRSFWLLLLFSLIGRLGWRLAEAVHGNPYRLENK